MAFTQCDVTTDNISQLEDQPNDVGGMTAAELKAAFDKAPTDIKGYINDTLIPEIDELIPEFDELNDVVTTHKNDYVSHMAFVTASGTNTYVATIEGITGLIEGMSIKVKFTNANTGASTININELGAVSIKKSNGGELSAGNIKAGQICHLVYTGSVFQLLGEGGEYGTAQAQHVLQNYTIGTENGIVSGAITNNGVVTITPTTVDQALSGFYASGSKVKGVDGSNKKIAIGTFTTDSLYHFTLNLGWKCGYLMAKDTLSGSAHSVFYNKDFNTKKYLMSSAEGATVWDLDTTNYINSTTVSLETLKANGTFKYFAIEE